MGEVRAAGERPCPFPGECASPHLVKTIRRRTRSVRITEQEVEVAVRGLWWRAAAVIFVVGNAGSAIYHVAIGEMGAAAGHMGLAVGAVVLWLTTFHRKTSPEVGDDPLPIDSHLDHLQRTLDGIALEVERLGEGQRFAQKILEARRVGEMEPRQ